MKLTHGTLKLATEHNTTIGPGADNSSSITISAEPAQINIALDGLVYTPDTDYHGDDTLSLTLNDLGLTGNGGPLQDEG